MLRLLCRHAFRIKPAVLTKQLTFDVTGNERLFIDKSIAGASTITDDTLTRNLLNERSYKFFVVVALCR